MIQSIMKLFGYKTVVEEVEEPPPVLDISEPVISFCNCIKEDFRRFKIESSNNYNAHPSYEMYTLTDRLTGESWWYKTFIPMSHCSTLWSEISCPFLTEDEKKFIVQTICQIFSKRASKLYSLKEKRRQRAIDKERQRLIGVYCK
jgi:hypothetical protein